ncbi:MAG: hypothetical protein NY202_04885 [Mollicutes bacterium UO1]
MPLFAENNQETTKQNKPDQLSVNFETKKPEFNLMTIIGQCLPFAPLVFEQFTGHKVPAMTDTMSEIQTTLSQIQTTQAQVLANQQQI